MNPLDLLFCLLYSYSGFDCVELCFRLCFSLSPLSKSLNFTYDVLVDTEFFDIPLSFNFTLTKPTFRIWDVEKESEITTTEIKVMYYPYNAAWEPNGNRISYISSGNLIVVLDINRYEFVNFILNFLPSSSDDLFTNLSINIEILILLVIVMELFKLLNDLRIWRKEQGTADEH
ncbi:MAG: hypothetical protein ACFE9L_02835 [Candidatus Hodarchaeota archaeon]